MTKRAMTKRQCTRLLILAIRKEKRSRRHPVPGPPEEATCLVLFLAQKET